MTTRWMTAALLAAMLAACSAPAPTPAKSADAPTAAAQAPSKAVSASGLVVTPIAEGLENPWGAVVLPDGALLVTERAGGLKRVREGVAPVAITGVPAVLVEGQGGLLDVALHPQFATNGLVYLSMATGTEAENNTRLVRGRLVGDALTDVQTLFDASPKKKGGAHFGGRILFLPDGTLLLSLGDGFAYREKAQDLGSDLGKIVRLTDTGQPAPGNPFAGRPGARAEIFSYGHRNVQGLTRDPLSGRIYESEHGPKGGDEVNILAPGKNYGWPVITYGVDYNGAQISPFTERPGMEQPILYWVPSIAPGGMAFYAGDLFPAWKGDLLVGALAGMHLRRVDLDADGKVLGQETLLADLNERIRQVVPGPAGEVYLLTDSAEGRVLKLTPKR